MLIICPECGKDISDCALVCPNCGFPMHEYVQNVESDNFAQEKTFSDESHVENKSFTQIKNSEEPVSPNHVVNEIDYLPCPKCGAPLKFQLVQENKGSGCSLAILLTIISIICFFISVVLGIIMVIVSVIVGIRGKSETVQYVICDSCGFSKKSRQL